MHRPRARPRALATLQATSATTRRTCLRDCSQLRNWQTTGRSRFRTLYAWAKRNEIPHYRAGRLLRFDPTEVADHFRQGGFAVELTADPNQPGESAFHLLSA